MKIVMQRIKEASVSINAQIYGRINSGLVLFIGFCKGDDRLIVDRMIDKLIHLRIFEDHLGKMNHSLVDVQGAILSISQFTLYANIRKGRRPSFTNALAPLEAHQLYRYMNEQLMNLGLLIQTGKFGEEMEVELINDGPVTIILDSEEL